MKTHREEKSKVIISNDRRVEQVEMYYTDHINGTRSTEQDYSKPVSTLCVPIDPEPEWDYSNAGKRHGRVDWNQTIEREVHFGECKFSQSDQIILTEVEEWYGEWRQVPKPFHIQKVDGVKLMKTIINHGQDLRGHVMSHGPEKWHWILRGEKQ